MEPSCMPAPSFSSRPVDPPPVCPVGPDTAPAPGEWLTFTLGSEEYGIDILQVQEIRSYDPPTRMVGTPAVVKGVLNLRGTIVPIVDMRLHFNLPEVPYDVFTVVIVLNINEQVVGMVIDSVSDVVQLDAHHIRPAPRFQGVNQAAHVQGIGSIGDRTLLLLDIAQLMQGPELGLMSHCLQ